MGDVIPFERIELQISGEAICSSCHYRWVAVAPIGTKELSCPACLTNKGRFIEYVAPGFDEIYQCNCGNNLFYLGINCAQCIECGSFANL